MFLIDCIGSVFIDVFVYLLLCLGLWRDMVVLFLIAVGRTDRECGGKSFNSCAGNHSKMIISPLKIARVLFS